MTASDGKPAQRDTRSGRPRDPEVDRAILQATLHVLTDRGYAGTSIERVAAEAGVGKTAIYRRYATKAELAAAALASLRDSLGPPPDTGSARNDLVQMLVQAQAAFARGPAFAMLGALLVEERRNPELFELFRDRVLQPRRNEGMKILQRGVQRGEIRADADLDIAIHAMVGSILARHVMGVPESRKLIEETVDIIWRSIARNP
ncbi:MAG: TetR/AcrR family transcriptional regulator [Chloroflexi bacterium]|nr:TetR/AcrR family transcriptional regulator [Chloroflexota bacterium]